LLSIKEQQMNCKQGFYKTTVLLSYSADRGIFF